MTTPYKISDFININSIRNANEFNNKEKIFPHIVFDNFFKKSFINRVKNEFPNYKNKIWHSYNNPLEKKKTCNIWNNFQENTYTLFSFLNSNEFINFLVKKLDIKHQLFADNGLHGGGFHIHKKSGHLNPHLDYAIHPKLGLLRKYNLIIFLNENYKKSYGGELAFFEEKNNEKIQFKTIEPIYNRVVFFDTSKNSWHGVLKINSKLNFFRKSLAVYYLTYPSKKDLNKRRYAEFSLNKNQIKNKSLVNFAKQRSKLGIVKLKRK